MKKSVGSQTYLFPLPSVTVNTHDDQGNANAMVASWTGEMNLNNFKKYETWYTDVVINLFNRKHIIEKLQIEMTEYDTYKVSMEMHFSANTWQAGDTKSKDIEVKGHIEWLVLRDPETSQLKIVKYYITTNES